MAYTERIILALMGNDEMRQPYEKALISLNARVQWFSKIEDLRLISIDQPFGVVVDLDSLNAPWEPELEIISARFPSSVRIGCSQNDSAQTAMGCLRAGFNDFLLKPVSPEELAWSIGKSAQKESLLQHLEKHQSLLVRGISQISNSTSPSLLKFHGVEYARKAIGGKYGAWIEETETGVKVSSTSPENIDETKVLHQLPEPGVIPKLFFSDSIDGEMRTFLPSSNKAGGLLIWGIEEPWSKDRLDDARTLFNYSEVSLLSLKKYEEVKQQTFIDDLTGLYNSRYLKFALNSAILKHEKSFKPFSVLFIDVDHFKRINDKHGHLVGSAFLVAIGKTIRNAVRKVDPVFRYGGDEFVVLLDERTEEGAREIAERVRKNVQNRVFLVEGKRIQTTVSIGFAVYPDHTNEKDTLLELADKAMYEVKAKSRNAVHVAITPPPSENLGKGTRLEPAEN